MKHTKGELVLYFWYTIQHPDGHVTRSRKVMAESFLTAFITWLYLKMLGPTTVSRNDTAGVSRDLHRRTYIDVAATAGTDTDGLVVGTGSTTATITDYQLGTKIAHGTGAGQLQYGASVVNLPSSTATTTSLICTRDFTNASGATITVTEIGIYAAMTYGSTGSSEGKFCIVRDLQTVILLNGGLLTLNYEFKTTS